MKCPNCGSENTKIIIGNLYRCGDCGHKFTENTEIKIEEKEENDDQSVYSGEKRDTQEDDMEDDLALLDDEDDLW